ncbi:N-6 DNA methylase [Massilia orientalis]|uniref:N-6 DNA methylase n=1 Tax=Massilia orientalis TaxID=3050128 RepID=A0ACC7MDP6_9BURK|nr:N-6 DNA methylase [Massilia sp. YIM B02787]
MKRDLESSLARSGHAASALNEHDRAAYLSKQATAHRSNIIRMIDEVGRRHDRRMVFRDFVTMSAVALSKLDLRQAEAREELYMQTVRKYSRDEAATIKAMFTELVEGMHVAPRDILGEIYMQLELGNSRLGQFFTPHHICSLMAEITMSDEIVEKVAKIGFVTVNEPASGSGATIIAMMLAMQERGLNYQRHVHVTAIDLDSTAAMMAYVQLSLMHVPAVIVHGNTLSLEEYSHWYTPAHIMDGWNARLSHARAEAAAAAMLAGANTGTGEVDGEDEADRETPRAA